jgi:hypothetical protein
VNVTGVILVLFALAGVERRAFLGVIAGGLVAAPLAGEAQPAGQMYRIGFLSPASPLTRVASRPSEKACAS